MSTTVQEGKNNAEHAYSVVVKEYTTKVYTLDTKEKAELYLIRLVSQYCKANKLSILDVYFNGHLYGNKENNITWEVVASPCVKNILA